MVNRALGRGGGGIWGFRVTHLQHVLYCTRARRPIEKDKQRSGDGTEPVLKFEWQKEGRAAPREE